LITSSRFYPKHPLWTSRCRVVALSRWSPKIDGLLIISYVIPVVQEKPSNHL